MESTETLASAVVTAITVNALIKAHGGGSRDWTRAIWDSLKELADLHKLHLYPKDGPYKGEYLLDFVLWKSNYGPLAVIESQWQHRRLVPIEALAWALEKLQGVKGDLKVLVFDWGGLNAHHLPPEVAEMLSDRLCNYQMHSVSEHYLLIWFQGEKSEVFEWKPIKTGQRSKKVHFSPRRKPLAMRRR